jgi:multiple sugar transport system ATP-binding protein
MAAVSFKNIQKSFGKVKVIHGIGFDIEDGEFVVLVGPSGCGKSTLLRMLAGLEEISGGEIFIDGKVVNDLESKDRDIAMVFQSYALYPHMTVRDNMGFSLRLRKAPQSETDQRVADAARILNLDPLLDRYPRELSGGQRQRVAMGRAIVRDPKVFLFDEPLSNLDAKLRVAMRAEIKALHQRLKTTTVYVTHDQIEAMTMADRIVVMHDGIVEQIGTPLELFDRPGNLFVAQFIGSPAMNVFCGTVQDGAVAALGARWPLRLASAPRARPCTTASVRPTWALLRSARQVSLPAWSWSSRPAQRPNCCCAWEKVMRASRWCWSCTAARQRSPTTPCTWRWMQHAYTSSTPPAAHGCSSRPSCGNGLACGRHGVSGSGKSTVGRDLAEVLGLPFVEGDACIPRATSA